MYYKVDENTLSLLIDSHLNCLALMRVFSEDESLVKAKTTIIKAFWNDVPEDLETNTMACAEHLMKEYEVIE